jgi:hypothetical protein
MEISTVSLKEDKEKKENIYSKICPDERFVESRIIRVKGRIIWLNNSINGRINIRPRGEPKGSRWETKDLN